MRGGARCRSVASSRAPPPPDADWPRSSTGAILRRVDADPEPLVNLLNGRGERGFRRTVDYTALLTPSLIAAIAHAERAPLRRNCEGRYRPGEICGLDFVPITCAQDSAEAHLYRIGATRPGEARSTVVTYRPVQGADKWRMDGIRCGEGAPSFNTDCFGGRAPAYSKGQADRPHSQLASHRREQRCDPPSPLCSRSPLASRAACTDARVLLQTPGRVVVGGGVLSLQAATANRPATKVAWAFMSRPPTLCTCPFLTIAIAS